jgi:hypothetical protein
LSASMLISHITRNSMEALTTLRRNIAMPGPTPWAARQNSHPGNVKPGTFSVLLQTRYPAAQIFGLAGGQSGLRRSAAGCCGRIAPVRRRLDSR